MGLSEIQLGLNRGEGGRLTRDRVWRMGSKDPTADIPVVIGDAVPAGPLQGRCRWGAPPDVEPHSDRRGWSTMDDDAVVLWMVEAGDPAAALT